MKRGIRAADAATLNERIVMLLVGHAFVHYEGKLDFEKWAYDSVGPDGCCLMTPPTLRARLRDPSVMTFGEFTSLAAAVDVTQEEIEDLFGMSGRRGKHE